MGRVLAIGLDSAEPTFVEALIEAGRMPTLERLRAQGSWFRLSTRHEYRAEHAWTSFATGQEPTTSGYWTTVHFDPATYACEARGALDAEPFYALGPSVTVAAMDVPNVRLARELQGTQVLGWGTHDGEYPRCSRPAGLLGDIEETVGPDRSAPLEYRGGWHQARWIDAYGRAVEAASHDRVAAFNEQLARTPQWSLGIAVFSAPHQLAHHCWHGVASDSPLAGASTAGIARDRLMAVHRSLDDAIGLLHAQLASDDVLVVFSPKGMEVARGETAAMILLPELLHRRAFGDARIAARSLTRWRRSGCPPVVPHVGLFHATHVQRRFDVPNAQQLRVDRQDSWHRRRRALAESLVPGLVARRDGPMVAPPSPKFVEPTADTLEHEPQTMTAWHPATWYQPGWPGMSAFVLPSFADAHVRINVVGREAAGLVAPEDYARACNDVEEFIRACRSGSTGRSVVADVQRTRGADPFDTEAPDADLIVTFAEDADALEHPEVGSIGPMPTPRTGVHSNRGFALVVGPGIGAGVIRDARLVDLPSTVLSLAGIAPSRSMDGVALLGSPTRVMP